MPEFVEDPSLLTKERLKSELLAHSVELPSGSATKDVYVQLYLEKLTPRNRAAAALDAFSSDEELLPPPRGASSRVRSSNRKSARKTEKVEAEPLDIAALSNERLREELLKHGVDAGPILASTRKPNEKKLQKLLENGPSQPPPAPPAVAQVNGDSDPGVYSDGEEELPAEPEPEPDPELEPEPAPVVERQLRSRTRISQQQTVQKIQTSSQSSKKEQAFPNDLNSPTGMLATCRQPIRGAGGCPVTASTLLTDGTSSQSAKDSKNNLSSEQRTATVSSQTPSSTKPLTMTPPAGQVRVVRPSMSVWIKLCLLGVVLGFLFLVYQSMETNIVGLFLDPDPGANLSA